MAQLMPLPLAVSCFSKIQIGFTFLVPAYLGSPRKRAVKRVCVCTEICMSDKIEYVLQEPFILLFHVKCVEPRAKIVQSLGAGRTM